MASSAERLIRDAVVARLHADLPGYRVVHELACGGNRADLAAVGRDRLLLFEIKSERDTLQRCAAQMRTFEQTGHGAILIAHRKWFDETPYTNGKKRLAWPLDDCHPKVWCFPEPPPAPAPGFWYRWRLPEPTLRQPRASTLLELLWKAELVEEAARHRLHVSARTRCPDIINDMAWHMTGREIAEAVCRQLRARPFPEADPPIHGKSQTVDVAA